MKPTLYGIHDIQGHRFLADHRPDGAGAGWLVEPVPVWESFSVDYRNLQQAGIEVIVRLNNGYGPSGTIPEDGRYTDFAKRCAVVAAGAPGCRRWIIGNEPNHSNEWPQGEPITPDMYVRCFLRCRDAIRSVAGHATAEVIPAAIAPWNLESGDWLDYWQAMLDGIGPGNLDGLALHAYTHGSDPSLVTSDERKHGWHWHFRVYRDLLGRVPKSMRHLPVYITETNQGDGAWLDADTGWVEEIYAETDRWNAGDEHQRVHCVCLYRWQPYDQWSIHDMTGVKADLAAAMKKGYTAPPALQQVVATAEPSHSVFLPNVGVGTPSAPPEANLCELSWDPRLDERGAKLYRCDASDGDFCWRLVSAEWLDEKESKGRHHVFVDVLDERGERMPDVLVIFSWADGLNTKRTEMKPGESYAADFAMYAPASAYTVQVDGNVSDKVSGLGMGSLEQPHYAIHTSYRLVFRKCWVNVESGPSPEPFTEPEKSTESGKASAPMTGQALDPRVMQAIIDVESGRRAFGPDGKPTIRFEAHTFRRRLKNDTLFAAHFQIADEQAWEHQQWYKDTGSDWAPIHTSDQRTEYRALQLAAQLDAEAAYESISMGMGQTMGFHHARLGYPSAYSMWKAYASEAAQIMGAVNYILSNADLIAAVNAMDWREIAWLYNGDAVDVYAPLLQAAYEGLVAG